MVPGALGHVAPEACGQLVSRGSVAGGATGVGREGVLGGKPSARSFVLLRQPHNKDGPVFPYEWLVEELRFPREERPKGSNATLRVCSQMRPVALSPLSCGFVGTIGVGQNISPCDASSFAHSRGLRWPEDVPAVVLHVTRCLLRGARRHFS